MANPKTTAGTISAAQVNAGTMAASRPQAPTLDELIDADALTEAARRLRVAGVAILSVVEDQLTRADNPIANNRCGRVDLLRIAAKVAAGESGLDDPALLALAAEIAEGTRRNLIGDARRRPRPPTAVEVRQAIGAKS